MSRLIDADALIADLEHDVAMDQDSLDNEELTEINRENIQFDKDCKQNAIDLLQHAPTIEERKKGKWMEENTRSASYIFKCSCCGKNAYFVHGKCRGRNCENRYCGYDFCPNCGADMRGDGDV